MTKTIELICTSSSPRIETGLSYIESFLREAGYAVVKSEGVPQERSETLRIYAGVRAQDEFVQRLERDEIIIYHSKEPHGEGFYIQSCPGKLLVISGGSETGCLYGCLELCERIKAQGELPRELAFGDEPEFRLRGPAIGLQKTKIEPPRLTYEYPITPERFPWFYDRKMWEDFLEMMTWNRCNILYIWSGHPFSSLVKVPGYPEALEVSEEVFEKNRAMFHWITNECDRRGIWLVQKFYNIHIPLPFGQKHGLDHLQNTIHPLVADYTKKAIIEFIKAFPHVGLMVCLGEALRGNDNKTRWFVQTILPAVKEGIKEAGLTENPPVILRGHDCDPYDAMTKGMEVYPDIYTMWKYNGEGLTTYYPRGRWQETHRSLNGLGQAHIMNVHILANLEPFRFIAPHFIQKCVQAGRDRLGCNGLHLYPLFYWDWPYSPDKENPRLEQIKRDAVWYKAWFRYAWKADRDERSERIYWADALSKMFGCSAESAGKIIDAFEDAAQCQSRILGRVGITEGNRQTMSLGMTLSQMTNVKRYRPNLELWHSVARKGEQPDEFIQKELRSEGHVGETPADMIDDVEYFADHSRGAFRSIDRGDISNNREEFERLGNDIEAISLMSEFYARQTDAALDILRYKYTMDESFGGDVSLLKSALEKAEDALALYRRLAELTDKTYLYANSMLTKQRKIPFPDGEAFGHWTQCLPMYEKDVESLRWNIEKLEAGQRPVSPGQLFSAEPLKAAPFKLLSGGETYAFSANQSVFTDSENKIKEFAPELKNLTGIRFNLGNAIADGVTIDIECEEDCYVLIGYMNARAIQWLQVPELETNTHADDRGGLAVLYQNAVKVEGAPSVNIHAFKYEKGRHSIYMGTGGFIVAGVVSAKEKLSARNAQLVGESLDSLDWLYEKEEELWQ
ncbi:MAG: hypothetical protein ACOX8S_01205 [Christensenellales bacterium]|jgi:hypothetical protein